ncbi:MAG: nucleotidyltransferase family protein [Clostridiales bacterium]|jgi:glucose-1-phosphate thymidylyltransferase|nr:nucleotidyltransferase family protein [Clostridiales bacterium]
MVAIILAAGYATRLYPLTENRPKALLPIGGKPILDYIIEQIRTIPAVERTVVVSNDKFHGHFESWANEKEDARADARRRLIVLNDGTRSEETRLGAIGDMDFAISEAGIDEDILVIAGDNFFTYRLIDLYDFYRRADADCVVVKKIEDREALKSLGVAIVDSEGRVVEFEEKPQNPRSDLAVFATYLYRRETLPLIREYLRQGNKPDAPGNFPAWLCRRQRVAAYPFSGECYDVGTPEAYAALCAAYASGL